MSASSTTPTDDITMPATAIPLPRWPRLLIWTSATIPSTSPTAGRKQRMPRTSAAMASPLTGACCP
jgi:hypothetical protein